MGDSIAQSHLGRVGCSELAAALGVSPYQTPLQLWRIKTGREERPALDSLLQIRLGNMLEQTVADLYCQQRGVSVEKDDTEYLHPQLPLIGHIDRRLAGRRYGLECKTSLSKWAREWGDDGTDLLPQHYLVQVFGYLLLTGWEGFDVAALLAGPELRIYHVYPDPEMFGFIESGLERFWRCVETDTPPAPINLDDANRLWPLSTAGAVEATHQLVWRCAHLKLINDQIKTLEAEKETFELFIKSAMGEHEILSHEGAKLCSWKTYFSSRFDVKRFREDHPALCESYTNTTESRRFFTL